MLLTSKRRLYSPTPLSSLFHQEKVPLHCPRPVGAQTYSADHPSERAHLPLLLLPHSCSEISPLCQPSCWPGTQRPSSGGPRIPGAQAAHLEAASSPHNASSLPPFPAIAACGPFALQDRACQVLYCLCSAELCLLPSSSGALVVPGRGAGLIGGIGGGFTYVRPAVGPGVLQPAPSMCQVSTRPTSVTASQFGPRRSYDQA